MVCARMREEFERTLTYPNLSKWDPDSERLLTAFDNWSSLVAAPPLAPPSVRCTDPDDQVFVDLALACGAHWLVSRDRAVLKLSRRVRGHGLQIIPPGAWRLTS
jgi:predicted nucleic acid-binding protein